MLQTDPPVEAAVREHLEGLTTLAPDQHQAAALRSAASEHQLDLELIELSNGEANFNCYRFALRLDELPESLRSLCFDYGGKGIGRNFVSFMIHRHLVETNVQDAVDDDVVVYENGAEITHAGI